MLVRIVKMGFDPDKTETFLQIFERQKSMIREFPGCMLLELYQDKNLSNQFFTYSYWKDEAALENYRNSPLFEKIWADTKIYFNQKPEAWSVDKLVSIG